MLGCGSLGPRWAPHQLSPCSSDSSLERGPGLSPRNEGRSEQGIWHAVCSGYKPTLQLSLPPAARQPAPRQDLLPDSGRRWLPPEG